MRALALDIGEVRTGVATSDASGKMAFPVTVLSTDEVVGHRRAFRDILEDYEPDVLVVGCPVTLAGERGSQAARIREQARSIAEACGLAVEFCDERFSSVEAKRMLREQGLTERVMRGKVDMIAASLLLQTWLDVRAQRKGVHD